MVYVRSPEFKFSRYGTATDIEGIRRRNSGGVRPLLGQTDLPQVAQCLYDTRPAVGVACVYQGCACRIAGLADLRYELAHGFWSCTMPCAVPY